MEKNWGDTPSATLKCIYVIYMYIQSTFTKNKYLVNSRRERSNSPALHRFVTCIENPSDYCVVFIKMCCLMFYREPCITQVSLAE